MYEGTQNDPAAINSATKPAPAIAGTWIIALATIIGLGATLRIVWMVDDPVWIDEAFTALLSVHPNFWQLIATDPNPPVYYLITRSWMDIAGIGPLAIKLPSLFFSIATLGLLASTFRQVLTRASINAVCLLFASSMLLIYYATEARQYSLSIALCVVAATLVLHQSNHASPVRNVALFVVSGLLVATHVLAVVPLFGLLVAALVLAHRNMWPIILPVGSGVLFTLFGWLYLSQDAGQQAVSWLQLAQYGEPTFGRLVSTPLTFLFGPGIGDSDLFFKRLGGRQASYLHWLALVVFLAGVAWLAVVAWHRKERGGRVPLAMLAGFLGAWAAFIAICLIKPLYVVGRYDVFLWPLFAMATAALIGFGWQGSGVQRMVASIVMFTFLVSSASGYVAAWKHPPASVTTKAAVIEKELRRGDALILLGEDNLPTLYQMMVAGVGWEPGLCRTRELAVPCRMVAGTREHMAMDLDSSMSESFSARFDDDWQSLQQAKPRRWLVVHSENHSAAAQQRFASLVQRLNELGAEVVSQSEAGGFSIYAVRRRG